MMEVKGLSLMPDALPPYFSRGHPLFFYFIGAAWIENFWNIIARQSHLSFRFFISNTFSSCSFLFLEKLFFKSEKIGFVAAFALCFQPIFLAQSGLLLPEVLVALLSLSSVYFYLKKNRAVYLFLASLAVLTKETGLVLIATLLFWTFLKSVQSRETGKWKFFFWEIAFISLPVLPFIIFLIAQKIINGWFFYPVHLSYITFNFSEFL